MKASLKALIPHRGTLAHQLLTKILMSDEERLCQQDPELWWSTSTPDIRAAKAYCSDCPLIEECGAYAIAAREPYGVWGGMDAAERHRVRRNEVQRAARAERARRAAAA